MTAPTTPLPALDPLDFLSIDSLLDDEERAIRDTVRQFVREQIVPEVGDWFERGHPAARGDRRARRRSASSGCTSTATACRARAPSPTASPVSSSRRATRGSAAPSRCRARWRCSRSGAGAPRSRRSAGCPAMHTGEVIGCFGLTEPDAGSDPGSMRTHARRDGVGLDPERRQDVDHQRHDRRHRDRLGAHRRRRDPRLHRRDGARPASRAPEIHKKISLRASVTSELVLQDVRVPDENLLPGVSRCAGRSPASTRPATGSSGAPSAPAGRASRRRSTTRRSESCSPSRSPRTS